MALQTSGAITLDQIHIEAGGTTGSSATINDEDIRGLIGTSSGAIMSFNAWYGASALPDYSKSSLVFDTTRYDNPVRTYEAPKYDSDGNSYQGMQLANGSWGGYNQFISAFVKRSPDGEIVWQYYLQARLSSYSGAQRGYGNKDDFQYHVTPSGVSKLKVYNQESTRMHMLTLGSDGVVTARTSLTFAEGQTGSGTYNLMVGNDAGDTFHSKLGGRQILKLAANGTIAWENRYVDGYQGGSGTGSQIYRMCIDQDGHIWTLGSKSQLQTNIAKINGSTGAVIYSKTLVRTVTEMDRLDRGDPEALMCLDDGNIMIIAGHQQRFAAYAIALIIDTDFAYVKHKYTNQGGYSFSEYHSQSYTTSGEKILYSGFAGNSSNPTSSGSRGYLWDWGNSAWETEIGSYIGSGTSLTGGQWYFNNEGDVQGTTYIGNSNTGVYTGYNIFTMPVSFFNGAVSALAYKTYTAGPTDVKISIRSNGGTWTNGTTEAGMNSDGYSFSTSSTYDQHSIRSGDSSTIHNQTGDTVTLPSATEIAIWTGANPTNTTY
tara:strand:- start:222 stop:1850 length:1629 start_codon:yes stop_codon:yes gene_type:complete